LIINKREVWKAGGDDAAKSFIRDSGGELGLPVLILIPELRGDWEKFEGTKGLKRVIPRHRWQRNYAPARRYEVSSEVVQD
jgi:hypothetical protein